MSMAWFVNPDGPPPVLVGGLMCVFLAICGMAILG